MNSQNLVLFNFLCKNNRLLTLHLIPLKNFVLKLTKWGKFGFLLKNIEITIYIVSKSTGFNKTMAKRNTINAFRSKATKE